MTHQKLYLYTKYISTTYFSKLLFVNVVSCQVSTWLKLNVSHNPKLESGAQRKKNQQILLLDHDPIAKNELKQLAKNPNLLNLICSFVPTNFWQFWVTFISQKFINHRRKKCIIKSYLPRSCTNLSIGDCTLAFALSQDGLYQEC